MTKVAESPEELKLRSLSRDYARAGYRVWRPIDPAHVPAFLAGLKPDLIAESKHDRVVVEVKSPRAVPGSNDLVEIAERVAGQPGWRFELVTTGGGGGQAPLSRERMIEIAEMTREAARKGLRPAAFAYAVSALEAVILDLAARVGLKPDRRPFMQLARELVGLGVLSHESFARIREIWTARSLLVHAGQDGSPTADQIESVLGLLSVLNDEVTATAA